VTAGGHLRSRCRHCIVTYQTDSLLKEHVQYYKNTEKGGLKRDYDLRFLITRCLYAS
jgi:hypothetical protein